MASLSSILTNISTGIPELVSKSITAIFKRLAEAFSITIDSTLTELTNTENIINANIAQNNYGKAGYYINAALYYEDGVDMVIDPATQNWIYDPADVSKQTITVAAFDEPTMTLKVAYIDPGTGLLAPLTSDIMTRFEAYMTEAASGGIEIPGIPITIVSLAANVFNASQFIVTYYGSYSQTNIESAVMDAMTAFKNSFPYNGLLYILDLCDYIKSNVPGVRDVSIILPTIDGVVFTGSTALSAGYFNFDTGLSLTYNPI